MPTDDALLFIDANTYLDLYRTVTGKNLLAPISEQTEHIFVTQQVADEVNRRKIEVAAKFLTNHFTTLKLEKNYTVPDHLFGTVEDKRKSILDKIKGINRQLKEVNKDLDALATDIMEKINLSTDEVSAVLTPLFSRSSPHLEEELQRATRKEKSVANHRGREMILLLVINSLGSKYSLGLVVERSCG
jgi:hypothetical protein